MADADTTKFLDEVKKGKPRKFVMICKGVKILSLIVYKKGAVAKFKKQAKEEGKGKFYHGVVDGKGQNIAFKLCKDDGYEKPPGRELILKDHLKTEFGLQVKPTYEIVAQLPEVDESDDDDARATEEASDVSDLEAELKKLGPAVKAFLADNPAQRVAVLKPTKVVKDYIADPENNDRDAADAALSKVKDIIGAASADGAPAQPGTSADGIVARSADDLASEQQTWTKRRGALEPLLLQAQAADREKATKLGGVWDYANEQAQAANYSNASKALDRLQKAVNEVLESAPKTDAERFGIRAGIVAEQRSKLEDFFRVQISQAKVDTKTEIDKIEAAIQDVPDEDPAELARAISEALDDLYDHAADAFNQALATESSEQVLKTLEDWRARLNQDALVVHVEQAKQDLGADAKVLDRFARLLDDVETEVKAAPAG